MRSKNVVFTQDDSSEPGFPGEWVINTNANSKVASVVSNVFASLKFNAANDNSTLVAAAA